PYSRDPNRVRSISRLARAFYCLVNEIHGRGVVARDINPSNVIIQPSGRLALIDFGISFVAPGPLLPGFTGGYASPAQMRSRIPDRADDYFAVGATLFFAATGLESPTDANGAKRVGRVKA